MLMLLHEYRVQSRIEISAVAEARRLHRRKGVEHAARPDRQTRRAQGSGEIQDVVGELAGAGSRGRRPDAGFLTPAIIHVLRPPR